MERSSLPVDPSSSLDEEETQMYLDFETMIDQVRSQKNEQDAWHAAAAAAQQHDTSDVLLSYERHRRTANYFDGFFHSQVASEKSDGTCMACLPDGRIHVCTRGTLCEFSVPNSDGMMVCQYTGVEHYPEETSELYDLNGGMGRRSGDPDQSSGKCAYYKRYTKDMNPISASKNAFERAKIMDDEKEMADTAVTMRMSINNNNNNKGSETDNTNTNTNKASAAAAGGNSTERRRRPGKRDINNSNILNNLSNEASAVFWKLINHKNNRTFKESSKKSKATLTYVTSRRPKPSASSNGSSSGQQPSKEHDIFLDYLKKYVRCCISSMSSPEMDTIHNLQISAREKARSTEIREKLNTSSVVCTSAFQGLCCRLIVNLWMALCSSKYLKDCKPRSTAYRPFVCGVIYSMKRGVCLHDGTRIIPEFPEISIHLPVLRGTGGNNQAKTLHSSSHKGIQTLSRFISMIPEKNQKNVFKNVIHICGMFDVLHAGTGNNNT